MTRDRTVEFRRGRMKLRISTGLSTFSWSESFGSASGGGASASIAIGVQEPDQNDELQKFLDQVADTKVTLAEMEDILDKIKSLHSDILSTPNPSPVTTSELNGLMTSMKSSSQIIQERLKDIQSFTIKECEDVTVGSPALIRIVHVQHSSLIWEFTTVINQYHLAQADYRDRCKSRIRRQLELTGASISDQEAEDMIEKGEFSMFTQVQGIIIPTQEANLMLADLETRHEHIMKLEMDLKELHGLFLDLAQLVDCQGDVLDIIEWHVNAAQKYTKVGQSELVAVEAWSRSTRKKKLWICVVVAILITVLLFIIFN